MLWSVQTSGTCLRFASQELRKDPDLCLEALKSCLEMETVRLATLVGRIVGYQVGDWWFLYKKELVACWLDTKWFQTDQIVVCFEIGWDQRSFTWCISPTLSSFFEDIIMCSSSLKIVIVSGLWRRWSRSGKPSSISTKRFFSIQNWFTEGNLAVKKA